MLTLDLESNGSTYSPVPPTGLPVGSKRSPPSSPEYRVAQSPSSPSRSPSPVFRAAVKKEIDYEPEPLNQAIKQEFPDELEVSYGPDVVPKFNR